MSSPAHPREPVPLKWAARRPRWVLPAVIVASLGLLGVGIREVLRDSTQANEALIYYTVRRGTLPIVVTERGNLESQQTVQVTCEVENFGGERSGVTGTQILFIVPNGSSVKKGDLLVELDSAPLKERLDAQFLALQRAEAEKIQANAKYENQQTQNETNLAEAQLREELALLEVESYEDETGGTFQIELENVEMDIKKARAEQIIRQTDFDAVKTLYELGYKSKGNLDAARLDLLKADAALASSLAAARQLQTYTYVMEKKDRKGKYDTARNNRLQVERNNESELAQALAAKESADRAYDKEKERHDRYVAQLEKCRIVAPQDGMVAYATEDGGRWNRGSSIATGAFVRERQDILSIPNLTHMQVNTAVHESVLDQVKPGLKAVIRVDAFPDRIYSGTVKTVAVLPDQGGWLSSDTKVYKTIVTIDEEVSQLKPGMTAVVEIDVERLTDVLSVPIQAIVQRADKNWCYVRTDQGLDQRAVVLGKTNDKFVEVREGLVDGDMVVLNPTSLLQETPAAAGDDRSADRRSEKEEEAGDAEDVQPESSKPESSKPEASAPEATPPAAPDAGAPRVD
ncbi:MAG: efflux RND transporter periplasmic adaptor subunit [Pirellulaceae bacterium]|nr:efflux RND transporter periplasmic adaptor subunit [Pirellulaceae bacterium]